MASYAERMAAANPFWLAGAEEDFGSQLDLLVARGELSNAQADQAFTMFTQASESQAEDLVVQMVAANLQAAATGQAPLMAQPGLTPTIPGAPVLAGVPAGMPAMGAPMGARAARGKVATLVVRQAPTGQVELLSTTPGRPALYQRDVTAAKRLKRVGKKIARLFPKRRSRKKVFKAAGSAIA